MILLLGGTTESLAVADFLNDRHQDYVLSVISDYGAHLAHQHAANVLETVFDEQSLTDYCRENKVTQIIDATHPFARVISALAIKQAARLKIPYLRYERPSQRLPTGVMVGVNSLEEACDYLAKRLGTVYLSTGSKTAPDYAERLGVSRLHVRVLPTVRVLEKLTAAGFVASQIDALQGPFSVATNVALFSHSGASVVVTKESGRQGGFQEKLRACEQLAIPCVVIRRPAMDYPVVCTSLKELEGSLE